MTVSEIILDRSFVINLHNCSQESQTFNRFSTHAQSGVSFTDIYFIAWPNEYLCRQSVASSMGNCPKLNHTLWENISVSTCCNRSSRLQTLMTLFQVICTSSKRILSHIRGHIQFKLRAAVGQLLNKNIKLLGNNKNFLWYTRLEQTV